MGQFEECLPLNSGSLRQVKTMDFDDTKWLYWFTENCRFWFLFKSGSTTGSNPTEQLLKKARITTWTEGKDEVPTNKFKAQSHYVETELYCFRYYSRLLHHAGRRCGIWVFCLEASPCTWDKVIHVLWEGQRELDLSQLPSFFESSQQ